MQVKNIRIKLFLLAGFILLYFVLSYRDNIRQFLQPAFSYLRVGLENIFSDLEINLERHRPLSTAEREVQLQLYVGEPFKSFNIEDWKNFWNIIYGVFPKEKKRQLSQEEISEALSELYPDPFSNFQEAHWKMFFGIIFNK